VFFFFFFYFFYRNDKTTFFVLTLSTLIFYIILLIIKKILDMSVFTFTTSVLEWQYPNLSSFNDLYITTLRYVSGFKNTKAIIAARKITRSKIMVGRVRLRVEEFPGHVHKSSRPISHKSKLGEGRCSLAVNPLQGRMSRPPL